MNDNLATMTFDDLKVGDRFVLGQYPLTREEVIAFASLYDPQPQHLNDSEAAANPVFDRMAASGWHTAVLMNKMVGPFFERTAIRGLAGAGVEQLRWITPVYPGLTFTVSMEIAGVRRSRSDPKRGFITMRLDMNDPAGRPVAAMTLVGVFETAPRSGVDAHRTELRTPHAQ